MLPLPPPTSRSCCLVAGVHVSSLTRHERDWVTATAVHGTTTICFGREELAARRDGEFDYTVVGEAAAGQYGEATFWGTVLEKMTPGGKLVARFPVGVMDKKEAETRIVLGGFVGHTVTESMNAIEIMADRPSFKTTAAPLSLKRKAATPQVSNNLVNNTNNNTNNSFEMIDEDELLSDCPTTGSVFDFSANGQPIKKAACKNCSCGLKEAEEAAASVVKLDVDMKLEEAKSSEGSSGCGNCSRGDAFRCGGCKYRGLPTFTPGTKPQIQIKADGAKVLMLDMENETF